MIVVGQNGPAAEAVLRALVEMLAVVYGDLLGMAISPVPATTTQSGSVLVTTLHMDLVSAKGAVVILLELMDNLVTVTVTMD